MCITPLMSSMMGVVRGRRRCAGAAHRPPHRQVCIASRASRRLSHRSQQHARFRLLAVCVLYAAPARRNARAVPQTPRSSLSITTPSTFSSRRCHAVCAAARCQRLSVAHHVETSYRCAEPQIFSFLVPRRARSERTHSTLALLSLTVGVELGSYWPSIVMELPNATHARGGTTRAARRCAAALHLSQGRVPHSPVWSGVTPLATTRAIALVQCDTPLTRIPHRAGRLHHACWWGRIAQEASALCWPPALMVLRICDRRTGIALLAPRATVSNAFGEVYTRVPAAGVGDQNRR